MKLIKDAVWHLLNFSQLTQSLTPMSGQDRFFFLAISSGTVRRMKENINEGILSADPKENSPNSLL